MNRLSLVLISSVAFIFAACGDDSSVTSPSEKVSLSTMTDSRDGQTYKTVTIGSQTWLAENLNYKTDNSYCYDDKASNCSKYGRLYTWAAAMDSAGKWSTNGNGCGYGSECSPAGRVRGVCPSGWHLPTKAEFNTLFSTVGGQSTAGKMLKSTSGWTNSYGESSGNGTDAYSFSALSAGDRGYKGDYTYEGHGTQFWSSTEFYSNYAYGMSLCYFEGKATLPINYKNNGFSVRCIKD